MGSDSEKRFLQLVQKQYWGSWGFWNITQESRGYGGPLLEIVVIYSLYLPKRGQSLEFTPHLNTIFLLQHRQLVLKVWSCSNHLKWSQLTKALVFRLKLRGKAPARHPDLRPGYNTKYLYLLAVLQSNLTLTLDISFRLIGRKLLNCDISVYVFLIFFICFVNLIF